MIRSSLSVLLLLIFIYTQVGYFVFSKVERYQIRKKVKRKIAHQLDELELTKLTFDLTSKEYQSLEWEHEHEFKYKNEMYDVVKKTVQNNRIDLYCIEDNEENILNKKLENLIEIFLNHRPQKDSIPILKKLIKNFYLKDLFRRDVPYFHAENTNEFELIQAYSDLVFIEIPVPPPEYSIFS